MLVECGFVHVAVGDGREFSFYPSLGRVAALGLPHEIVQLYASLHGSNAAPAAAHVLAGLCDQDDASPLIGWHDATSRRGRWWQFWRRSDVGGAKDQVCRDWRPGLMPAADQVQVACWLMRHGIVGKAKPGAPGAGGYSERFDAAEYIAAACAHLGLSSADAAALSMTEFQLRMEMKYPALARKSDLATREEYRAAKRHYAELDAKHAAKAAADGVRHG